MPLSPNVVEKSQALLPKLNAPIPLPSGKPLTDARLKTRAVLLDAAEKLLIEEGASSLKARPLAKAAAIAVGSVYNLFDDLDALILEVNARTFVFVGSTAIMTIKECAEKGLEADETLFALAEIYIQFVENNQERWESTLRLSRASLREAPLWYLEKQAVLFQIIAIVLADVPNLKPDLDLTLHSRTMWGAVNGLITGGFHGTLTGDERRKDRRLQVTAALSAMLTACINS